MTILQFLRWLRKYGSLIAIPDINDSASFRAWCTDLMQLATDLSVLTETTVDDVVVATLSKIVANDDSWDSFHTVLLRIIDLIDFGQDDEFDEKVGGENVVTGELRAGLNATAEKLEIDPATIVTVVVMVARFIAWLRNRRKPAGCDDCDCDDKDTPPQAE